MSGDRYAGLKAVGLVGAFVAALAAWGSLLETDLKGCDVDGDGNTHVVTNENEVRRAEGWTLTGGRCYAEGIYLPRIDAVDAVGRPLPGFTAEFR